MAQGLSRVRQIRCFAIFCFVGLALAPVFGSDRLCGVRDQSLLRLVCLILAIPLEFVQGWAAESGAVECAWVESDRSFTGFVAEVWFADLPSVFASRWASVVGYFVSGHLVPSGPGCVVVSVPCSVPCGQVVLVGGVRGGRVRCRLVG